MSATGNFEETRQRLQHVLGGAFNVLSLIGHGGMGEVYLAHHKLLGGNWAIKVLSQEIARDPALVERFLTEARIESTLLHQNIVQVVDVGQSEGLYYLRMRYIEGEDLNVLLQRQGRLDPTTLVNISVQVASALEYAHDKGIIHRDLKPSNIRIDESGTAYVIDFGIARVRDASLLRTTQAGEMLGTTLYMSPEQEDGRSADARSDLYALGVIMYEMLAGENPFSAPTGQEMRQRIRSFYPPLVTSIRSDIPPKLSEIIDRLISKDPGYRYQRARKVKEELATFQAGFRPATPASAPKASRIRPIAQTPAEPSHPAFTPAAASETPLRFQRTPAEIYNPVRKSAATPASGQTPLSPRVPEAPFQKTPAITVQPAAHTPANVAPNQWGSAPEPAPAPAASLDQGSRRLTPIAPAQPFQKTPAVFIPPAVHTPSNEAPTQWAPAPYAEPAPAISSDPNIPKPMTPRDFAAPFRKTPALFVPPAAHTPSSEAPTQWDLAPYDEPAPAISTDPNVQRRLTPIAPVPPSQKTPAASEAPDQWGFAPKSVSAPSFADSNISRPMTPAAPVFIQTPAVRPSPTLTSIPDSTDWESQPVSPDVEPEPADGRQTVADESQYSEPPASIEQPILHQEQMGISEAEESSDWQEIPPAPVKPLPLPHPAAPSPPPEFIPRKPGRLGRQLPQGSSPQEAARSENQAGQEYQANRRAPQQQRIQADNRNSIPGTAPALTKRSPYLASNQYQANAAPPFAEATQAPPEPQYAPEPRQAGQRKRLKHEAALRSRRAHFVIPPAAKPMLFVITIAILAVIAYLIWARADQKTDRQIENKSSTQPADVRNQ